MKYYGVVTGGAFCHFIGLPLGVDSFQISINHRDELRYFEKMTKKFVHLINKSDKKASYLIEGIIKTKSFKMRDIDVLLGNEVVCMAESYHKDEIFMLAYITPEDGPFPHLKDIVQMDTDYNAIRVLDRELFPKDFEKTFGRRPKKIQKEIQLSLINIIKNIQNKKEKGDHSSDDIETETIKNIESGKLSFMDELPEQQETLAEAAKRSIGIDKLEFVEEETTLLEEEKEMNKLEKVESMVEEINRKMKLNSNVAPGYENIPGIKEAVNNAIVVDIDMTIAELQRIKGEIIIDSIFTIENINELSMDERLELGKDVFGLIKVPKENSCIYLTRINNQNVVLNVAKVQIGVYNITSKSATISYMNNQQFTINIPDTHIDLNILNKNDTRCDNNFRGFGAQQQQGFAQQQGGFGAQRGFGNTIHLV